MEQYILMICNAIRCEKHWNLYNTLDECLRAAAFITKHMSASAWCHLAP